MRAGLTLSKPMVREAVKYLGVADPVMARLVVDHPLCSLGEREYRPFHTLVASIISQQLSAKAADTIERRVADLVSVPFQAGNFLSISVDTLRSAGLSKAKARYILELAARVSDRRIDLDQLPKVDDTGAIEVLCELPGIGQWTAEMFLIFGLGRPDILSLGDAGLQRAARRLHGSADNALEKASRVWSPYRSVASWYLWRHLDSAT